MPPYAGFFSTNPSLIHKALAQEELHEPGSDQARSLRVGVNRVMIDADRIRPHGGDISAYINEVD